VPEELLASSISSGHHWMCLGGKEVERWGVRMKDL